MTLASDGGAEEILTSIWCEVLGTESVRRDDNFFDLGGDSMSAVTAAERATRAGLAVTVRDMFVAATLGDLLAGLPAVGPVQDSRPGPVAKEIPLLPSQLHFLAQGLPRPEHYNASSWLRVRGDVSAEQVADAVWVVLARHEAFRLTIQARSDGYAAQLLDAVPAGAVLRADLGGSDDIQVAATRLADRTQRQFRLDSGGLARFVVCDLGAGQPPDILVVVHHLICDALSWRTILTDLERALAQAAAGSAIRLTPPAISYSGWSRQVAAYAAGGAAAQRARYWLERPWAQVGCVPAAGDGTRRFATVRTVCRSLPAGPAVAAGPAAEARLQDVVAGTLFHVWSAWLGHQVIAADVYTHGRDLPGFGTMGDVIGWLASIDPLVVALPGRADPACAVAAVARARSEMPADAAGFAALRWYGPPEVRRRLASLPRPELYVNYRGRSVGPAVDQPVLAEIDRPAGEPRDLAGHQPYKLEVTADAEEDRLIIGWHYSAEAYPARTIEDLADQHVAAMAAVRSGPR